MNKQQEKEEITRKIVLYNEVKDCATEAIEEYEAKLAKLSEPEKPKLRHGDYGVYKSGGFWWAWQRHSVIELVGENKGIGLDAQDSWPDMIRIGNSVDNLKALSGEPLEEFEIRDIKVSLDSDGWLRIKDTDDDITILVPKKDKAEFHRKLGRVIHTAKQKNQARQ